jgi:ribosomal protein L37AE/L43A
VPPAVSHRSRRIPPRRLSKRRRAEKTHVRLGGPLTVGDTQDLLAQKEVQEQVECKAHENSSRQIRRETALWRCGKCRKPRYNAYMCHKDAEMSDVYNYE